MEGFAEAIGFRRANLSAAMRDLIQRQEKLEKSAAARHFAPAGFAAVLGGRVLGCDLALVIEGQHAVVERVPGLHRRFRQRQLGER